MISLSNLYNIKASVVSFIADIRLYKGGIILYGDSHYDVKGPHVRNIVDALEPGDILLRTYKHYLGSKLTKGYWSHAAMFVGGNDVIHMLGDGITKEDILTFTRCDDVAILRATEPELISIAIEKANFYMDKDIDYDYNFDKKADKFYCTEFVWQCYGCPVIAGLGKFILPDDFLNSIFTVVPWRD